MKITSRQVDLPDEEHEASPGEASHSSSQPTGIVTIDGFEPWVRENWLTD